MLLYDIFEKLSKYRGESDGYLYHEFNLIIPDEVEAIKYLITFRKELCLFLDENKFF